jgi:nicotinamidase-related amidase
MAVRGLEPGKRAALLISEVQNGIANPAYDDTPLSRQVTERGIVAGINTLAMAFREARAPVTFATIAALSPDWAGFRVNCAETHHMQVTQHLPLLATVTDSESIIASLKAQVPA